MKDCLISIIVPVYNVQDYLDECIKSIVSQTYRNIEIILIDDGSTDNSSRICDSWAEKDSRIKVIHKKNGGLSDARNTGLKLANGDFIGFVDSDDYIDSHMYERLLNVFNTADNIGVASIKVLKDKSGIITPFLEEYCDFNSDRTIKGEEFTKNIICQETCWTVWNKLYRSDLLNSLEFKVGRNNEDTLFLFYLGQKLKESRLNLYELSYPAYYYRIRENSICTNIKKPLSIDRIKNIEEMLLVTKDTDKDLTKQLMLLYLKANISFLDLMFNKKELYSQYFKQYQKKVSCISYRWVLLNCSSRLFIKYLLYRIFPLGRKYMISIMKFYSQYH